jgi:hypothetical protein
MSQTQSIYTKGSLAKELTMANLVANRVVDGVVQEGQAAYTWTSVIEQTNSYYEKNGGMGNKILEIYKDEVAYTGDPTISGQISGVQDIGGGRFKVSFAAPSEGFRKNDKVGLQFGRKLSEVVEAASDYMVVARNPGDETISTADFPQGSMIYQFTRGIDTRGTVSPEGLAIVPQTWENYVSIIDDATQQNIFDSKQNTIIRQAGNYIVVAPIQEMMERFFRNCAMNQFLSLGVNPAEYNLNKSATKGIHQQIRQRGLYELMGSQISKTNFESKLRTWYLANPGNPIKNKIIGTGSLGMAMIAEWYKDLIKYDRDIAITFTDGSVNGLNATKIFIPGFEEIQVVKFEMLDMDGMGARTAISGFEGLPRTSGNFYFLDFTPVRMRTSGLMAPAFQKTFFGGAKYYFSYQKGLSPMDSLESVVANATPLTMDSLELTSTDRDTSNLRIYTMAGINIMNGSAQGLLENNA